jgi:hypothetical protein
LRTRDAADYQVLRSRRAENIENEDDQGLSPAHGRGQGEGIAPAPIGYFPHPDPRPLAGEGECALVSA